MFFVEWRCGHVANSWSFRWDPIVWWHHRPTALITTSCFVTRCTGWISGFVIWLLSFMVWSHYLALSFTFVNDNKHPKSMHEKPLGLLSSRTYETVVEDRIPSKLWSSVAWYQYKMQMLKSSFSQEHIRSSSNFLPLCLIQPKCLRLSLRRGWQPCVATNVDPRSCEGA